MISPEQDGPRGARPGGEKIATDLELRLGRDAARDPVVKAVLQHVRWHGLDVESALCVAVRVLEAALRHEREARAATDARHAHSDRAGPACKHLLVELEAGIECERCDLFAAKGSPLFTVWSAELVRQGVGLMVAAPEKATYACRHGGFHVGAPCPSAAP